MPKPDKNSLLVLSVDADAYLNHLNREKLPQLDSILTAKTVNEAKIQATECNIIFGEPNLLCRVLDKADHLVWAQSTWAGITPLLCPECRTDYVLTGVKGVFGPAMSEYVFCYMLMHERKAMMRLHAQAECRWDNTLPGRLNGKTLGIMGVGSIGSHVAQTAKHFGMYTKGYTLSDESCPCIDEYSHSHPEEFGRGLDYLVSVLPDLPSTDHLIDSSFLAGMKSTAVIINVGRGNVIDDHALSRALNKKQIAGAVLDVFKEEPLPPSHPFWKTRNLIITYHTAAPSFPQDIAGVFIENYHRFIAGRPLKNVVDFKRGY